MSWWLWVLVWVVLVLAALSVLFVLVRRVWRGLRLLFADLSTATERLSAVTEELERLQDRTPAAPEAAVFDSPADLRARRFVTRTKQRRSRRRSRT